MNKIIRFFLFVSIVAGMTSCETYDEDFKQEFSSIHPMSGEWVVLSQTDETGATVAAAGRILRTYNTSDNSTIQMWIAYMYSKVGFKIKTDVNVGGKTFGNADDRLSTYAAATNKYYNYSITEGVVTTDGYDTPTGHKADLLVLKYTSVDNPNVTGKVYTIRAFRQTGWGEDLPH